MHIDLLGWLYVTIELMKGSLPWDSMTVNRRKLGHAKQTLVKKLFEDVSPVFVQIYDLLNAVKYVNAMNCIF